MRGIPAFLTVVGIALLTGCASSPDAARRIDAFSSATALTTQNIRASIEAVEAAHYENEVDQALALDNKWKSLSLETVHPLLDPQDVETRVMVLQGVEAYAQKLSLIMGNAPLDAFDKASQDLGTSLKNLNGDVVQKGFLKSGLSETELQAVTAAVNAIGHWIIEAKRNKSAKAAIDDMQPHIAKLAAALQKDFGWLQKQIVKDYDEALSSEKQALDKADRAGTISATEKWATIRHFGSLLKEGNDASNTMKAAADAVKQLAVTHTQLADAFHKDAPALDDSIRSLVIEGQRIRTFYESLKSK